MGQRASACASVENLFAPAAEVVGDAPADEVGEGVGLAGGAVAVGAGAGAAGAAVGAA